MKMLLEQKKINPLYPRGYRECHGDYRTEIDLENPSTPLYQYQSSLPSLPIPDLAATCALYLRTVQPLVSRASYEHTRAVVTKFLSSQGPTLQQRLKDRAKSRSNSSFLAEWWNTLGYLHVRDPVVFNVSYFFHFSDSVHPMMHQNQLGRAAGLLFATMAFRNAIVEGSGPIELIGKHQARVCATAYKYMFNACRIPHAQEDSYRLYDPAENHHVVVMIHHKFFSFDLVHRSSDTGTPQHFLGVVETK